MQPLVNKGLLWSKAANHLGFKAPVLNIDTLEKTPPFYVAGDSARDELTSSAVNLGKIYQSNIEHLLIDRSRALIGHELATMTITTISCRELV